MTRSAFISKCLLALSSLALGLPACGPADLATPPRHVVLVSIDTLGALHSSAYGYARPTSPALESLAARGVLFENAYTQQVWTLTAHISLMMGLNPQSHLASERRVATSGSPTLAEILRARGFATGAFTGGGGYMKPRFGLGRGFDAYRMGDEDAAADNVRRLRWLAEQARRIEVDPDHRFFLFAHYFDVHSDVGTDVPYDAPPPHGRRFLGEVIEARDAWPRRGDTQLLVELEKSGTATELDRRVLAALYDGGALHADQVGLAALLAQIDALGMLDDTLIVVTSDHGEEILEHGKVSHQQPYEETARVPLVFAGPGVAEGLRLDPLVELVDVMPTILALLDIEVPPAVQGRDLSPLLRGEAARLEGDARVDGLFGGLPALKWRYPSSLVREIDGRRWSYVNTVYDRSDATGRSFETRGPGELYRLDEDPGQQRDVRAEHPDVAATLQQALLAWYAENEALARALERRDPAAPGAAPLLDEREVEALRALGYGSD